MISDNTNCDLDAQRFRDYAEGHVSDSPVESDWRQGYSPYSDGPHEPCPFCSSRGHESADCDDADESVDEHLNED